MLAKCCLVPLGHSSYKINRERALDYLNMQPWLYCVDGYAGWDPNWFKAFLGVMLLLAVMVNLYVKNLSTRRKVG